MKEVGVASICSGGWGVLTSLKWKRTNAYEGTVLIFPVNSMKKRKIKEKIMSTWLLLHVH